MPADEKKQFNYTGLLLTVICCFLHPLVCWEPHCKIISFVKDGDPAAGTIRTLVSWRVGIRWEEEHLFTTKVLAPTEPIRGRPPSLQCSWKHPLTLVTAMRLGHSLCKRRFSYAIRASPDTHLLVSAYRQAVVFSASCARCVFWVVCQEKVQDEVLVKGAGENCTDSTSLFACVVGCYGAWQKEAQSLHHHNNLRGLRQHCPAHGVHQVGHPPCAGSLCITSEINHHQTTLARLQLFPRQPASTPSIGSSDRSPAYKQSFQVVLPTAVG